MTTLDSGYFIKYYVSSSLLTIEEKNISNLSAACAIGSLDEVQSIISSIQCPEQIINGSVSY